MTKTKSQFLTSGGYAWGQQEGDQAPAAAGDQANENNEDRR